jgi:hypothetical protein
MHVNVSSNVPVENWVVETRHLYKPLAAKRKFYVNYAYNLDYRMFKT